MEHDTVASHIHAPYALAMRFPRRDGSVAIGNGTAIAMSVKAKKLIVSAPYEVEEKSADAIEPSRESVPTPPLSSLRRRRQKARRQMLAVAMCEVAAATARPNGYLTGSLLARTTAAVNLGEKTTAITLQMDDTATAKLSCWWSALTLSSSPSSCDVRPRTCMTA